MHSNGTAKSVITAFDAAAQTYDRQTPLQCEVARHLVEQAATAIPVAPKTILDLGCGTGHVVEQAQRIWPQAKIAALDAAPAMLGRLNAKFPAIKTICRDARHLDGIDQFELMLSSMALHWMKSPQRVLNHWRGFLKSRGRLLVALPVAGSLREWRELAFSVGLADGSWEFPSENFADDLCIRKEIQEVPVTYPAWSSFLFSLRSSGAHRAREGYQPASSAVMRRLMRASTGPITVTFRILFLTLLPARV